MSDSLEDFRRALEFYADENNWQRCGKNAVSRIANDRGAIARRAIAANAPVILSTPTQYCRNCDGCGWYEGGEYLKTTCEQCGGSGVVTPNAANAVPNAPATPRETR